MPLNRGDNRRVFHLASGLARHAHVTLAFFGAGSMELPSSLHVVSVGRRCGPRRSLGPDGAAVALGNLRLQDPRLPLQARAMLDHRMWRLVRDQTERADVIHATYATLAPYLDIAGDATHTHIDFTDSVGVSVGSQATLSRGWRGLVLGVEASLMSSYERRIALEADSASFISEADRRAAPEFERAIVVPNGVDPAEFPYRRPERRPRVIVFFGNLGYWPNRHAAAFVAREVLPRMRRRLPDCTLLLAGAAAGADVRQLAREPGVHVLGEVPRMADALHGAALAMIPMFSGAGMKNKVLEAFSTGTPVVTNDAGIQGVEGAAAGHHYLSGEDADSLSEAGLRLLGDEALGVRLSQEALALVTSRYSWSRQVELLLNAYSPSATSSPAGDRRPAATLGAPSTGPDDQR